MDVVNVLKIFVPLFTEMFKQYVEVNKVVSCCNAVTGAVRY